MIRHFLQASIIGFFSCVAHGYTGPFLGLDIGAGIFNGDHTYRDITGKDKTSFTKAGFLYGGYLGYMKEIGKSRVVLAIEGYFHTNTANIKENLKSGPANTKVGTYNASRDHSLGIAFIGGKLINPKVLVYLKLAIERGKFKIKYKNSLATDTSFTRKKTDTTFIPALGLLHKTHERIFRAHDKIFTGFEYQFSNFYKDIHTTKSIDNMSHDFSHTEHRVIAKITYMF
ncbi:MAG TPA: hypothetical protein VNJ29_02065 [Candidatus Nitrosotenuis sp.]|nr:hypothetical protein [Candidatus Nitrosotenuis sp.]